MTTKSKWPGALLAVAITLVAEGVRAQDQQRQQRPPEGTVTVNDLAGKPGEHLGQVQLIGVVAAISQGQGFVLVDKREYDDCGLTCLVEPVQRKYQYAGAATLQSLNKLSVSRHLEPERTGA
jgi:hypothetical protein